MLDRPIRRPGLGRQMGLSGFALIVLIAFCIGAYYLFLYDNKTFTLSAYCFARVRQDDSGALTLPAGPYLASGKHSYVYVVREDRAYRTKVAFGPEAKSTVVIVEGLSAGEAVITSDYSSFIGRKIIAVNPKGGQEL